MKKKKYKIGYTTGVFDLFHIGHLNILEKSKELCEYLIVGVSTDELVRNYKNKTPAIPFGERMAIVEAIRFVDRAVPQETREKMAAYDKYKFDVMFVGDDWKGSETFMKVEKELNYNGSEVVYFPYTKSTSSTLLIKTLKNWLEDKGDDVK